MFGHIQVNVQALSDADKTRYRSVYCGLCRTLGQKYGLSSRLALSYDFTFLILLLSSLYEPEQEQGTGRCAPHPMSKHQYSVDIFTEYAADMTVALTYFKCIDDWNDDKNLAKRLYAATLHRHYTKVKGKWPAQCTAIEQSLQLLTKLEREGEANPDTAANCCGRFMSEIFAPYSDNWTGYLKAIGYGLGKFIYLADAACDFDKDKKSGGYNPLLLMNQTPQNIRPHLTGILGEVSKSFEILPLVRDEDILKNILYSGLWLKYNAHTKGAIG